jgi:hypothetical protein
LDPLVSFRPLTNRGDRWLNVFTFARDGIFMSQHRLLAGP